MGIVKNFNWMNTALQGCLAQDLIPMRFKEIQVAKSTAGFLCNKFVTVVVPNILCCVAAIQHHLLFPKALLPVRYKFIAFLHGSFFVVLQGNQRFK